MTTSRCAPCQVPRRKRACDAPGGPAPRDCPTRNEGEALEAAWERLQEPETLRLARHASLQEAAGYVEREREARPALTRIEEVCAFAARTGYRRLGLAFCAGLAAEAKIVDEVFAARGFEVVSVVCKVGAVAKEELGLADADKVRPGTRESMCHPLAQAEILNRAGTELNVLLGLCVGHDALFLKHAEAPCTVLAVKDRVLGHNPLAAVYHAGSYRRHLLTAADAPSAGEER